MVAADVPTRTGNTDGGDGQGGFMEGSPETPHTVSKRTRRGSSLEPDRSTGVGTAHL